MDTSQILQDLRRQRDQLNEAILALERLAAGAGTATRQATEVVSGGENG